MIGSAETIPAEPGGGAWVVQARIIRGPRREAVALFAVLLTDGGVVWSTDVERATTFLTRGRAAGVIRAARAAGDCWTGVALVTPARLDDAAGVARLSMAGALGEQ